MMPKLGNPERAPYAKPARNGPFDKVVVKLGVWLAKPG